MSVAAIAAVDEPAAVVQLVAADVVEDFDVSPPDPDPLIAVAPVETFDPVQMYQPAQVVQVSPGPPAPGLYLQDSDEPSQNFVVVQVQET